MIKSFTVKNFLSFKDEVKVNFERDKSDSSLKESFNTIQGVDLLKTAVFYGANASGKSNFSKAFVFFHNFVVKSLALASLQNLPFQSTKIPVVPFLLNTKTEKAPSFFEIEILNDKQRFVYGFRTSSQKIHEEWLHQYPHKKILFERKGNKVTSNKRHFKEADSKSEKNVQSNILFLTKLESISNTGIAHTIVELIKKINVYPADQKGMILDYALNNLSHHLNEAFEFLKEADFTMNKLETEKKEVSKEEFEKFFPPELRQLATTGKNRFFLRKAQSTHTKYDEKNNEVSEVIFDFHRQASEGTKNMLGLSLLFIDALKSGKTLFIDELSTSLHPLLCRFVVNKFNSKNNKNAQLFFTTHDTSLLDNEVFRRDQIFFVKKDQYGASTINSLSNLGERKDLNYSKRYFEGRYGALPYIKSNESKWD